MNNSNVNELLEKLGLTEYESKTLSTLFRLNEAEAPAVSRLAQVPKTRVYDVLDKLINKKLVIEIRGRPKKYRVIDAGEALAKLLEGKKEEVKQLEEEVYETRDVIKSMVSGKEGQYGETVMKVKDAHDFERILAQEIERAKQHIIGFTELTDKHSVLTASLDKARKNNVKVKLINAFGNETLKKLKETELKRLEHGLNAVIIDGKKVILALSDFKRELPDYHFTIWHDNKAMVNTLTHYFDKCWQQAKAL